MANTARENILKKIQQALKKPVPIPFPLVSDSAAVYQPSQQELEVEFAENFSKLLGKFSFCSNMTELTEQLNTLITTRKWEHIYCVEDDLKSKLSVAGFTNFKAPQLASCDASITTCESLVARTGTIVLSSQNGGRTTSVYAPVHICIAYTSQLIYDISEALQRLQTKYNGKIPSSVSFATGPSRTADIEKTLVVGVHGPKEVFCFLVEDAH